jgi:hypothetical protein
MNDERLEALLRDTLSRDAANEQANEAAAMRVLARLGSLPRQKISFWHLPGVLLNWEFAPAWPRMAALASCAALGFAIGIAGFDERADPASAPYSFVSGADFGSIATAPLSGDEP